MVMTISDSEQEFPNNVEAEEWEDYERLRVSQTDRVVRKKDMNY